MLDINWQQVLGPLLDVPGGLPRSELTELTEAIQRHSPRAVRLNPARCARELPFATEPVPWHACGRRITDNTVRPGAYLNYAAGEYYIQDAGSMLALRLADVKVGQSVCDACAAPGGKATGLLEQLKGTGFLLANEVIRSRLEVLQHALARVGTPNYLVTNLELEALNDLCSSAFDCVMVDAPCTGQSMVARGKQSLAAFSARQIEHSAARQQRILRAAADLVQPGGRLIYSTCTFAVAENEDIITWLRSLYPSWTPVVFPELARWHSPTHPGCYRLWPHRDQCDGAFVAALERPETDSTAMLGLSPVRLARPIKGGGKSYPSSGNFTLSHMGVAEFPWLQVNGTGDQVALWKNRDELHYFADTIPVAWIAQAQSGVPIAVDRGHQWQPAYASSVVNFDAFQPRTTIELSDQQTAEYLDGAAIRFNDPQPQPLSSSWTNVTYRNCPIGWGKISQGVLKNHLPKPLRKKGAGLFYVKEA